VKRGFADSKTNIASTSQSQHSTDGWLFVTMVVEASRPRSDIGRGELRYGERAIGESGGDRGTRGAGRWHHGMQLYNAAGPPSTPSAYYYYNTCESLDPATCIGLRLFEQLSRLF